MAENLEVDRLVVTLEADYKDFLNQIDKAVQEAVQKLKQTDEAPKRAKGAWEQLGGYLKGQFLPIVSSVVAVLSLQGVLNNINGLIAGIKGLGAAAVTANQQFETFRVQFETLLGSAEAAQARIDELAQFGLATPFELDEIVDADRLLQTFGGTALATGENLRRIGDSAAAVNASFKEVAFWTGRMFSALQAGRPFGESAMRLQELGILSGEARNELEAMQKAGASGQEIWAKYSEIVDTRFAGAMDRLSKTLQGVMSNIADFQAMLLREGGAEFFEGIRGDAIEFFDIINDPDTKEALVTLAKSFGTIADTLREAVTSPILEGLKDVDPQQVNQLAQSLDDFSRAIGKLLSGDTQANINTTLDLLTSLVDVLTLLTEWVGKVVPMLEAGGQALAGFINPLSNVVPGFYALTDALEKVTGYDLSDWSRSLVNAVDDQNEAVDAAKAAYEGMRGAMADAKETAEDLGDTVEEQADKFAEAREKIADLAASLDDLRSQTNEKAEALQADHAEKIAEIDEDLADKQKEIAEKRNEDLIDLDEEIAEKRADILESTGKALDKLEEDTAKRRREINENTTDQLSKLERDTQDSIRKIRDDAALKEYRDTQDHQRDMQELQHNYLFDLEDAVKNRDARAIVDLRRRLQKEKKEKEEDFQLDQRRAREDADIRIFEVRNTERQRRQDILKSQRDQLADLAESEAEKREEILASQAEQLADLAEHEAEKRAAIEESFGEQMAKAQEHHDEQLARENERYAERKQALDEALAKRLEDVAKELADEKDITEEGARAILEALNKTFGAGGDIDALMESFQARRRQKMTVEIFFEQAIRDQESSESAGPSPRPTRPASSGGNRQGRGSRPSPRRFQEGGLVPGPIGAPLDAIVHGGEWVIPHEDVKAAIQARQMNAGGNEMRVKLDITGSAPPGIRSGEVDAIAGVLVKALNEAGIRARR